MHPILAQLSLGITDQRKKITKTLTCFFKNEECTAQKSLYKKLHLYNNNHLTASFPG